MNLWNNEKHCSRKNFCRLRSQKEECFSLFFIFTARAGKGTRRCKDVFHFYRGPSCSERPRFGAVRMFFILLARTGKGTRRCKDVFHFYRGPSCSERPRFGIVRMFFILLARTGKGTRLCKDVFHLYRGPSCSERPRFGAGKMFFIAAAFFFPCSCMFLILNRGTIRSYAEQSSNRTAVFAVLQNNRRRTHELGVSHDYISKHIIAYK
jgi:hypothetical protein